MASQRAAEAVVSVSTSEGASSSGLGAAPLSGRFKIPHAEVQAHLSQHGLAIESFLVSLIRPASKLARPPVSGYYVGCVRWLGLWVWGLCASARASYSSWLAAGSQGTWLVPLVGCDTHQLQPMSPNGTACQQVALQPGASGMSKPADKEVCSNHVQTADSRHLLPPPPYHHTRFNCRAAGLGASGSVYIGVNLEFPGAPLNNSVRHGLQAKDEIDISVTKGLAWGGQMEKGKGKGDKP